MVAQYVWEGQSLFFILDLMSMVTCYLVIFKGLSQLRLKKSANRFLDVFWSARSLQEIEAQLHAQKRADPFSAMDQQAIAAKNQKGNGAQTDRLGKENMVKCTLIETQA